MTAVMCNSMDNHCDNTSTSLATSTHPCKHQLSKCPYEKEGTTCPLEKMDGSMCAPCLLGLPHESCTGGPVDLHPCMRVWGTCKYGDSCAFSRSPQVWCLYCLRGSRHLHCDGVKPYKVPSKSDEFQASVRAHEKARNSQRKMKKFLEEQRVVTGETDKPLPVTWMAIESNPLADISLMPMLMYVAGQYKQNLGNLEGLVNGVVVPLLQEVSNRTQTPLPLLKIALTPEQTSQLESVSAKWAESIVHVAMWLPSIRQQFETQGVKSNFTSEDGARALACLATGIWHSLAEHLLPSTGGASYRSTLFRLCSEGIRAASPEWIDCEGVMGVTQFLGELIAQNPDATSFDELSNAGESLVGMCGKAEDMYPLKVFTDLIREGAATREWRHLFAKWDAQASAQNNTNPLPTPTNPTGPVTTHNPYSIGDNSTMDE